jgi:hypothetical protein
MSARHLTVPRTAAQALRQEITDICVQIDHRLGNRAGTAERGVYFWHWPPDAVVSIDVLTRLRADAIKYLQNLTNSPKETP